MPAVRKVRINALSFALMIKALQQSPHALHELADETGLTPRTLKSYVLALEKVGAIHVCGWEKDRRGSVHMPIYSIGSGKPAAKRILTQAERSARHRAKKQAMKTNALFAGPTNEVNHD